MHLKRTLSILIAAVMIISAIYVTPYSAIEETSETTEPVTVTEETSYPEETTEPESVTEETTTVEQETTEPETTPKETEPAENEKTTKKKKATTKLKIKGTTIYFYNKKVLNAVNSYRSSKGLKKLKNDEELTEKAYARASMLAVNYSTKLSAKASDFPKNVVLTKGATYLSAYNKFKESSFAKSKGINACGIANLKVGNERMWAVFADKKEKTEIEKVSSYPKKAKAYSVKGDFYVKYFKAKNNTGSFKNKTVRYKKNKKYAGQLYFKNYKDSVNSYFKVANSSKHTPVKYSTNSTKTASVSSYGNVTCKKVSAFKDRTRYTPKKGDFILFHWYKNDGYLANHVGIVYKVTDKNVITIEGNTKANDYRKSVVSKRVYKNYKRNSQIVGFVDLSEYMTRETAESLANLAKKQIGKRGRNYYNHTKAWKEVYGCYGAANWCAIFCGWLLEQKGYTPYDIIRWSPSCTLWIKQCHKRATAKINAKVVGSSKKYSYKITFKA